MIVEPIEPFDRFAYLAAANRIFAAQLLTHYNFGPGTREYETYFDVIFLLCEGRLLDDALGFWGLRRADWDSWRTENPKMFEVVTRAMARGNYSDGERFDKSSADDARKIVLKRRHKENETWFTTRRDMSTTQQRGMDSLFANDNKE
jgi:hypothetical protein